MISSHLGIPNSKQYGYSVDGKKFVTKMRFKFGLQRISPKFPKKIPILAMGDTPGTKDGDDIGKIDSIVVGHDHVLQNRCYFKNNYRMESCYQNVKHLPITKN